MTILEFIRKPPCRLSETAALLVLCVAVISVSGRTAFAQSSAASQSHMSESLRSSVSKVVVIAGQSPAGQAVTGSYEQTTDGLVGGIDSGSKISTVSKDIGGIPVSFPIPMLTIPGMIYGGLSGAAKREIQEFRDALTKELSQAGNQTLSSGGLAEDVYFGFKNLPNLESKVFATNTPIPADTDAVLYVGLNDIVIDVQGKEAILTSSARATLRRLSDGAAMFENVIQYQDRDTLSNWTDDNNALWRDYVNFARHYLGREISAEVFERVKPNRELHPVESETVDSVKRNNWQGVTESTSPTLAWKMTFLGGDGYGSWVDSVDESNTFYEVEIYDAHQLIYAEYNVQGSSHTLAMEVGGFTTNAPRWT